MTLIRWQPFREIDSLQREMNRLFDRDRSRRSGKYGNRFCSGSRT